MSTGAAGMTTVLIEIMAPMYHVCELLTPFPTRGIAYAPLSIVVTFRRIGRGEGGRQVVPVGFPGPHEDADQLLP